MQLTIHRVGSRNTSQKVSRRDQCLRHAVKYIVYLIPQDLETPSLTRGSIQIPRGPASGSDLAREFANALAGLVRYRVQPRLGENRKDMFLWLQYIVVDSQSPVKVAFRLGKKGRWSTRQLQAVEDLFRLVGAVPELSPSKCNLKWQPGTQVSMEDYCVEGPC